VLFNSNLNIHANGSMAFAVAGLATRQADNYMN
jgi:hypothetical protein